MDSQELLTCRVCLDKGATIEIFDVKDSSDLNVYLKLCQCLGEKIEDEVGLPRHLCERCLESLNLAIKFIKQYKESDKFLRQYLSENINTEDLLSDENVAINITIKEEYLEDNISEECPSKVEIEVLETNVNKKRAKTKVTKEIKKTIKKTDGNKKDLISNGHDIVADKKLKEKTERRLKTSTLKVNTCKICKVVFETPSKLLWHWNRKHNSGKQKCSHCDKLFDELSLTKHLTRVRQGLDEPKPFVVKDEPIDEEEPFDVDEAEPFNVDEAKPIVVRKKAEAFVCETCGMKLFDSTALSNHRKSHRERKTKECPHCKKQISEIGIRKHIMNMHSSSKNYSCRHCAEKFATRERCKDHERKVHERGPRQYNCKLCDKQFLCNTSVKNHMKSVHTGERPWVCELCGKSFVTQVYLKTHMLQHTGKRPFECPICGKGHSGPANVKSHVKHNHRLSDLDDAMLEKLSKLKINYLKHMRP